MIKYFAAAMQNTVALALINICSNMWRYCHVIFTFETLLITMSGMVVLYQFVLETRVARLLKPKYGICFH